MLEYIVNSCSEYVSRGDIIQGVLSGEGFVDILPGRPDQVAEQSDWDKGERYNPDLAFDPNSYSRIDKFDGLEIGQSLIDDGINSASGNSDNSNSSTEEK